MQLKTKLAALAAKMNVTVEYDRVGIHQEFTAEAPRGFCFDGDLHEYVSAGYTSPGAIDLLRKDMIDRLEGSEVVPCPQGDDCEWCNPDDGE